MPSLTLRVSNDALVFIRDGSQACMQLSGEAKRDIAAAWQSRMDSQSSRHRRRARANCALRSHSCLQRTIIGLPRYPRLAQRIVSVGFDAFRIALALMIPYPS